MKSWRSVAVAAAGLLVAEATAQTGTLLDLGSLLSEQKNLSMFNGLIQKYPKILLQLPSTDGVTIAVPSNDAFDKIPYTSLSDAFNNNDEGVITNVLKYHILQGTHLAADLTAGTPAFFPTLLSDKSYSNVTGGQNVQMVKQAGDVVVFVSGEGRRSTLVQADLKFTGGVVQVIDSLLIPPTNLTATTSENVFNYTSYQGAVYTADRIEALSTTPNVTLFAPNNEAFQNLGPAISNLSSEDLASIIDYMTLDSIMFSTALNNGSKIMTKGGENITVLHSGNNVYINSAQLLNADILIANGVLHVIDNVLNPQGPNASPNPQLGEQVPAFASASEVDNLPFTTAIPCTVSCPVTSTSGGNSMTGGTGPAATSGTTPTSSSTFSSSSSKGLAAARARETGFGAAGLMVALGGAVLMI